ncbi:MAG TPA: RNA 2'-phosphotransferase [Jiangellaceae bacterium]|nr:RNA 2'-phosphotransferase [Jiangellaceae bacterium]
MTTNIIAASRFLSYVLRHRPDTIGVNLDEGGWIAIETLLAALAEHGRPITRDMINQLAAGTNKQRFEIRNDRIRAAQGHSIQVDLHLPPVAPPPLLYHGTVERYLARIRQEGLQPRSRTHVHLSADPHTAAAVGARRGRPTVLIVDAAGMHRHGFTFYQAANGVWLTKHVPPRWLDP